MPVPAGARFRIVTREGQKIRLAFVGKGTVVEAKNLRTGATHTPSEFKADRKRRLRRRMTA